MAFRRLFHPAVSPYRLTSSLPVEPGPRPLAHLSSMLPVSELEAVAEVEGEVPLGPSVVEVVVVVVRPIHSYSYQRLLLVLPRLLLPVLVVLVE